MEIRQGTSSIRVVCMYVYMYVWGKTSLYYYIYTYIHAVQVFAYLLKDGDSGALFPSLRSDSSRHRAFRITGILWRTMCK